MWRLASLSETLHLLNFTNSFWSPHGTSSATRYRLGETSVYSRDQPYEAPALKSNNEANPDLAILRDSAAISKIVSTDVSLSPLSRERVHFWLAAVAVLRVIFPKIFLIVLCKERLQDFISA